MTFHVLLPYEMWEWNNQKMLVMFFGSRNLGNWKAGVGIFTARYACDMMYVR